MKRAQHGKPESSAVKRTQKRVVSRRRRQAERRDPGERAGEERLQELHELGSLP